MGELVERVEVSVIESKGSDEILEFKIIEYLVQKKKKSLQARYWYSIIFLLANLVAWCVRDYGQKLSPELHHLSSCGIVARDCFHTTGVLRISLGCFIFFFAMFITTCDTTKLYEARSTWHLGLWSLKFVLLLVCLVIPFFIPTYLIQLYGELARVGAGVFLILQLISVIEFVTWWNNYLMPEETKKQSCFLGIFMSTIFYIASLCGIGLMYMRFAPSLTCSLNIFFITWTVILLVVMMAISLHSKVNKGLLSSGLMASYIVFLCWSAIRSEPAFEKCSPLKQTGHVDWTTVPGFLIAIGAIVMATFSTGIDSQTFQFSKVQVQEPDDIPYSYGFFHLIFSLGAMYFAMLFISWNLESSKTRKWSIDVGWASTWVKIVNEWFAATIYMWKLIYPALRDSKVMHLEDGMQQQENAA